MYLTLVNDGRLDCEAHERFEDKSEVYGVLEFECELLAHVLFFDVAAELAIQTKASAFEKQGKKWKMTFAPRLTSRSATVAGRI